MAETELIRQNMDSPADFVSVFARNCEVRRLEKPIAEAFLDANHRYGSAKCRYCYGIFLRRLSGNEMKRWGLKGEKMPGNSGYPAVGSLLAVGTFSNARKWMKGGREIRSYEWVRYASLQGIPQPDGSTKGLRVAGGMGKILQTFIADVKPDDIMTYAIAEWSEGDVYRKLGFKEEGIKTFGPSTSIKFRMKLTGY